nr:YbhB/YbcL family Raf kinase inhibitor-like protein [Victivallis sp. Marseille-Q1083]
MKNCCCSESILLLPGTPSFNRDDRALPLLVESSGISGGIIQDRFGKRGHQQFKGMPTRSLPVAISSAPVGTVSYALTLLDYDAVPVAGFCWIHWLAANISTPELPENASIELRGQFVQGVNSWHSPLLKEQALPEEAATGYGGMVPPNAPHRYLLTVYALDCRLTLQEGFKFNELLEGLSGHILAAGTLVGIYDN